MPPRLRPRPLLALSLAALAGGTGEGRTNVPALPAAAEASASAAATPTFAVTRFEVTGSTVLPPATVDELMRGATGPAVTLPQIRRALRALQQAYRDQGFPRAAVTLPRQPLGNGAVTVRVEATPGAAPTGTAFPVRHWVVRGNTALSAEEVDALLGPATGEAVPLPDLRAALARLQAAYRERGFPLAAVTLPQQILTDGTVALEITQGAPTPPPAPPAKLAEAPAPLPQPSFEVREFNVAGNTLLPPAAIAGALTNALGPAVTLPEIQKAVGALQLAYRERGHATVSVALPPQTLTNATVHVQVTEGVLAEVRVTGNRHFSTNNVLRALPSLRTNEVLNSQVFQRELDLANQNRDRQIFPTLGPGPEPGTSALTLRVKDRRPLHGRAEVNNHATPGTPDWRVNTSAQYNNLWQLEHQVGFSYSFTPEAYKNTDLIDDYLLNRPLVASYGAYYRLPFGAPVSVADQISQGAAFGFDEATRQFRLPPAGARPDLSVFASVSSSDTGVQLGPQNIITESEFLTIISQDSGQNLSQNDSVGARLSIPLALDDTRRLSLSAGLDWKRYGLDSYNTNNLLIISVGEDDTGNLETNRFEQSVGQPTRRNELTYLPLVAAADYSQSDAGGTFAANLTLAANWLGDRADQRALAYSPGARPTWGRATASLTRDQRVLGNWSLLLRAAGQAATGSLISNEQFAVGGVNNVRGYYEGDEYGDQGWFGSAELRSPFLRGNVPVGAGFAPVWLRASAFLDYGQRFLLDDVPGVDSQADLWSAGFGVSANVNNRVDLRIIVGWPLIETRSTPDGDPRAAFSIGGQF
ncbi:MAG: POTRA domain-containing protein [Limisphaerales bacterium]